MMKREELFSLLSPPLESKVCEKFLDYYLEAKNDQLLERWADAITKYGKFLEFVAKAVYLNATNDKTDYLCSQYTRHIRNQMRLPDSLRLYIPTTIDAVYNLRNNRDAAHASLNIDSNFHDCSYSSAASDWILGELLVEFGSKKRDSVNALLQMISVRRIPLVFRNSEGKLLVISNKNPAWLNALILLYSEKKPLTVTEISAGIHETPENIRTQFAYRRQMVCKLSDGRYELMPPGAVEVERVLAG